MFLRRFIQLLAILLLGSAAHAAPSSPEWTHQNDRVHTGKLVAACDLAEELSFSAAYLANVDVRKATHVRVRFRAPGAFALPAAKNAAGNEGRSFACFAEPLPDAGADLLPPFYYVFLFRLTLF